MPRQEPQRRAAERLNKWFGTKSSDHFAHALVADESGKLSGAEPLMDVMLSRQLPSIVRATSLSLPGQYAGRERDQNQAEALGHGLSHEDPLVRLAAPAAFWVQAQRADVH